MNNRLRILVISSGEFSGSKASLIAALRKRGSTVLEEKTTLRAVRFRWLYWLAIMINSIVLYRKHFMKLRRRTYASYVALSKAASALASKHSNLDVVLLIGANYRNFWRQKQQGVHYAVFTDHTNMLSKQLPDFGFQVPEKRVHPSWNRIERRILGAQDHIFVMGSHVKDSMVADYGIDPARITRVGGGPNLDVDIERDGRIKNYDVQKILFVGLDGQRKGLAVVLKAFPKVKAVFPHATLNIVGAEGVNGDGIVYYGRLGGESLKRLFYESHIFAMPSFREPFGIVFVEAMLAKNVCIGTNIEGIPEIIVNGETGYLVEPNDHNDLAVKIVKLFSEPSLLRQMGENAYQRARRQWGWDRAAEKMLEVLRTREEGI